MYEIKRVSLLLLKYSHLTAGNWYLISETAFAKKK